MEEIDNEEKVKLIQSLIEQFEALPHRDEGKLDALHRRAKMIITKVCGDSSTYLEDVDKINFCSMFYPSTKEFEDEIWKSGQQKMINLLNIIEEDLRISKSECVQLVNEKKEYSNRVFIVHGHDDLPKERLAHILIDLGLTPIILHDQPNKGRTLVEKFEEEASDVGYAFVIMTPDDLGIEAKLHEEIKRGIKQGGFCYRPRQNVVLELGFFYAKLGRNRVCCLVKGDLEKPSDISGITYLQFINKVDEAYREIVRELRALGYDLKSD
jgi:predicted nucleotide-binding protein